MGRVLSSEKRKIRTPTLSPALGATDRERERLMRQGGFLRELTAAGLRAAGITTGMRVLDLGSGAGDVGMLAADLVGTSSTRHLIACINPIDGQTRSNSTCLVSSIKVEVKKKHICFGWNALLGQILG